MRRLLKNEYAEPDTSIRTCDWPGCKEEGSHRAPKSRDLLNEYFWFCLDHVRTYNARWNYYAGMSDEEVEADLRRDTTWQRPTWKLGAGPAFAAQQGHIHDPLGLSEETGAFSAAPTPPHPTVDPETARALEVFRLEVPFDTAALRARYKDLVKQHHPDRNGGTKAAEEEFKRVQEAYQVLVAFIA